MTASFAETLLGTAVPTRWSTTVKNNTSEWIGIHTNRLALSPKPQLWEALAFSVLLGSVESGTCSL